MPVQRNRPRLENAATFGASEMLTLCLLIVQTGFIAYLLLQNRRHVNHAVTEQRRGELMRSARLVIAGELAQSIAHAAGQPLSAIRSNTDAAEALLDKGPVRAAQLREILADIRGDALRANGIMRSLRALLSEHEPHARALDLNAITEDALQLVRQDASRRHVAIRLKLDPELPAVVGDQVHLQQVLLHLVMRALRSMESAPLEERRLHIRTKQHSPRFVEVTVSDSASAVPVAHSSDRYRRLPISSQNRNDIALHVARDIVRMHRGELRVEGNSAGGATFSFFVPTERGILAIQ